MFDYREKYGLLRSLTENTINTSTNHIMQQYFYMLYKFG